MTPTGPPARHLIVNADDLGQSHGVTRGIMDAHDRGIVTSASLMVRGAGAAEAASEAAARSMTIGLHVDLGEWAYQGGRWRPVYRVVDVEDAAAVAKAVDAQLEAFVRLVGRPPSHLDSHQHVHRVDPARSVVTAIGRDLDAPVRELDDRVHYCGAFYGQSSRGHPVPRSVTPAALVALLASLPAGTTELGCHPGYCDDLDTMYRVERSQELRTLCDPHVRSAIDRLGIVLCTFAHLRTPRDRSGLGQPVVRQRASRR